MLFCVPFWSNVNCWLFLCSSVLSCFCLPCEPWEDFVVLISLVTDTARPPSKRRKRKSSAGNNSTSGNVNSRDAVPPSGKQKRSPGPQGFNIASSVPGVGTTPPQQYGWLFLIHLQLLLVPLLLPPSPPQPPPPPLFVSAAWLTSYIHSHSISGRNQSPDGLSANNKDPSYVNFFLFLIFKFFLFNYSL